VRQSSHVQLNKWLLVLRLNGVQNDPTKRAMLHRLLTEEEAALAAAKRTPDDVKKAY
jgi:hypothetical protein